MAALALDTDVEARLGRALTADEDARIGALLDDASATIRNYTGQEFEESTSTDVRFRVRRGRVVLPQRPVSAVSAAKDVNGDDVFFQWDGLERVFVTPNAPHGFAFIPWSSPMSVIDITYTHGYATIPDDVVGVTCSVALRALGVDPTQSSTVQETAGPFSRTVGTIGAAGAAGLLPAEMKLLDGYKRVGGFVQVGPF